LLLKGGLLYVFNNRGIKEFADFSRIYKATKHITFTILAKKTFPCNYIYEKESPCLFWSANVANPPIERGQKVKGSKKFSKRILMLET
jgi:hypothetical protein